MGRKFELWEDPYGRGFGLWEKRTVEIEPGVTVLVGCNGIGKTTLLNNIKLSLEDSGIPVMCFDNLEDGGANAREEKALMEDFGFLATSICSSEGENIFMNLCDLATKLGSFIKTGVSKGKYNPFGAILYKGREESKGVVRSNERWLLFDAVDSGLSIDNIVSLK